MSIISTNYIQQSSESFTGTYVKKTKAADCRSKEVSCEDTCIPFGKNRETKESVVDDYKKKHPEDAAHVNKQVQAGKRVKMQNGAGDISAEDLSMEEYKKYFYALLDTIPYDPTRRNDDSFLKITEKGWEQMKKDPEYEALILGYFVEDRSVRNPFFGWGGNSGSISFEHFGASIEEHHGEGFSKSVRDGEKPKTKREESWWEKRRKRMKLYMKEQQLLAEKRAMARKEENQREYRNHQLESQQRLHDFLTDHREKSKKPLTEDAQSAAVLSYESTIGLFGNLLRGIENL